ncbi:MAG: putative Ig domain-containing protein, partial [Anaerolineae bacterium]|nr:putative Ig domain-containing protein [Anaerolineae bacterium]
MRRKSLSKLIALTIVTLLINALVFQVSLAVPGSVTTLFEHDGRQFHGNMFDVNVITPLRITSFDVNIGLGNTTVTVYYRNGSYVGSETNPGAWTVLGSANVSGAGQNQRTSVIVSSPVLQPGTYGFYITVTPTFELGQSVDMYYTSGSRTVGTADISLNAGIGVGGLFGDPAACAHWSRNLPNNPCIFPDRSWNGTVYYDTQVAPIITSGAPGNGTVGVAYNHSFSANGNTPISYSVTGGALPPGLTLSGDGVISGTPTTAGTYSGTISATNGVAPDAAQGFNITIVSPTTAPSITSGAPGNGTVGAAYSHTYTASGTTPINYTVTAGALPAGLTLSGGVISGTPTTAGTFTGTVTASNGTAPDASQNFNIIIAAAATAPSITSGAPANGTVGAAYTHTYTASGTTPINYTVTAGALPAGLTLSGGVISGTPTTAGTFTGTVTASNGTAPDASQNFNIIIAEAATAPSITSGAPGNGTVGAAYTHTYTASGTAPINYTVTAGALPA